MLRELLIQEGIIEMKNENKELSLVKKIINMREFMIVFIILIIGVFMTFASPHFLTAGNMRALFLRVSIASILAIGMTILLTSGDFDLSVGSVLAFSGAIVAISLTSGVPLPFAILFALAAGTFIGLLNGVIVAKIGINPFITTLATMMAVRGLVMIIMGGRNIAGLPDNFTAIGRTYFLTIQSPIWISLVLIVLFEFLLRKTKFFRQNYYIGGNPLAAMFSGIEVQKMRIFNFMLTGFLAGSAGIINTARFAAATTTAGQGIELQVVAAVILGGASLKGGEGTIVGAFFGALLMGLIINSLNLLGVDVYWQTFVQGSILLFAVIVDQYGKKKTISAAN